MIDGPLATGVSGNQRTIYRIKLPSAVSRVLKKIFQTNSARRHNALDGIHRNVDPPALNIADVRRGKFSLFSELFLRQAA
jgi:hypothetical protein